VTKFLVKYSSNYIGSADFDALWVSTYSYFSTATAAGSQESYLLTGFDEGTTYYFAVKAIDEADNWGVWPGTATDINAASFSVPTDSAPAKITGLTAETGSNPGEIDLSWTAPGDDGNTGILDGEFMVKYSLNPSDNWDLMPVWEKFSMTVAPGIKCSRTIQDLPLSETTYYFYIKAGDERPNWSELSNKTTGHTLDAIPPNAISDLTALVGNNGGEVTLKWTAPGDDGTVGTIVNGQYQVKYSAVEIITNAGIDSEPFYVVIPTDTTPGEENSAVITGLLEGTSYWFAVRTKDETGYDWSVWNSSADVSTVNTLAYHYPKEVAPAAITDLLALTSSNEGETALIWTVTGDDGLTGDIVNGKYRIRWATYSVSDWKSGIWNDYGNRCEITFSTDAVSGDINSKSITGLRGGVTYYFRIFLADEKPNWSGISNGATNWVKLYAPAAPVNFTMSLTTGNIVYNWTTVADPDTSETSYFVCTDTGGILSSALSSSATTWSEAGLLPNILYKRKIKVSNYIGAKYSNILSSYTLSLTPSGLTVLSKTPHTVTLSWTAAEGGGGTSFLVEKTTYPGQILPEPAGFWTVALDNCASTSCVVSLLKQDTLHRFRVKSYNAGGVLNKVASSSVTQKTDKISEPVINVSISTSVVKGNVLVNLPAGALGVAGYIKISSDPVTAPIEVNPKKIPVANGVLNDNLIPLKEVVAEFKAYDLYGRVISTFAYPVSISLPYPDNGGDGFADGYFPKVPVRDLKIYVLDETEFEWLLVGGTTDTVKSVVTADVSHFSVYTLIGTVLAASDNLNNIIVYPNPYKPGDSAGYGGDSIIFANLTASAKIEIFNIAGELVKTINHSGGNEEKWLSPDELASGVYIYLITNPQGEKKPGKFAIIK